jgi:fructose-1,6-bisphosphatase I
MTFPKKPVYYSANHGNEKYWTSGVRRYVKELQGIHGEGGQPLNHRYIGSMVADFHRNLLRGGVFVYPGDMMNGGRKPYGKLRLMYEGQAMAFIAEQAGGLASDGVGNILDVQPHQLHQKIPCFIGSRDLVERAEHYIREYDQEWVSAYLPYRNQLFEYVPA